MRVEVAYRPDGTGQRRVDFSPYSVFETQIDPDLAKNRALHFRAANIRLAAALSVDPDLAARLGLSPQVVEMLTKEPPGRLSPKPYTWHHVDGTGQMMLVDTSIHDMFSHFGGFSEWNPNATVTDPYSEPAQPADLTQPPRQTGGETKQISASAVPESAFHGQRTRFAHPGRVNTQIARTLGALAEAAGVTEITRLPEGTYQVRTPGGRTFLVSVAAGPTGTDVARSTVDRDSGRVEIRISDRAIARAVPRALAHEVAEAAAIIDGLTERADVLTNQVPTTDQAVASTASPHDRGRLAELRYLATQLQSANPLTRWRASHDAATLLGHLGLVSGRPDLETGEFHGRSPGFEQRLTALTEPLQVLVAQLNALPQVGSLPSAVAEQWRYLARGVLTGTLAGAIPAGVLALAATTAAAPALLTVAAVTASATLVGSVVNSLAEYRHALRADYLRASARAAIPQSAETRQLLDMQAAELANRAEQLRRHAAEGAAQLRNDLARTARVAQTSDRQHRGGPVGRHSDVEGATPAAASSPAQSQADAQAAAQHRAGDRISEVDAVPPLQAWVMRHVTGPATGFAEGAVAHQVLLTYSSLPSVPMVLAGLGAATVGALANAIGQRIFALRQATAEDQHQDARETRAQARTRARIELDTRPLRDQQAALEEAAARRLVLDGQLIRAEEALIDDPSDPAAARAAAPRPPPAPPAGVDPGDPSRGSDLAARADAMDVPAIADSSFDPQGRRNAHPERVERQARSVLAQLGPRQDGVRSATIDENGVVRLRVDGQAAPVRVSVVAVDAAALDRHSLVARVRPESDGSYTLEISDRAAARTVGRAALAALDQVLATRAGAPSGVDQLAPGTTSGPIDPATLTAVDRARLADLTRLLGQLVTARPWSRRGLGSEYQAAVRAAGLELPTTVDGDPDVDGTARRRAAVAALDPDLLARLEGRDPLPAQTPSLWVHQRKWLGAMAVPALGTPLLLVGLDGFNDGTLLRMLAGALSPLVVGTVSGIAEWSLNRTVEARQNRLDVGTTIPSEQVRAREKAHRDEVAARVEQGRERASAADQAQAARQQRLDAALARAERNAVLRSSSLPARILDVLTRRADPDPATPTREVIPATPAAPTSGPTPPSTTAVPALPARSAPTPVAPQAAPGSPDADRAAMQEALEEVTRAESSEGPETESLRVAKPRLMDYAGMVVAPPIAAAGVALGVATGIGGIALSEIFNPAVWSTLNPLYLGVLAGSLVGAVSAAVSGIGVFGQRLVGNRTPELEALQEAAQTARASQLLPAARRARLAPLQADLRRAEADLAAVETARSQAETRQAALLIQAVPLRGRGPLRALADLFGGTPPDPRPPDDPNGGPTTGPNGGPTDPGPNGGPTHRPNGGPNDRGPNGGPTGAGPAPHGGARMASAIAAVERAAERIGTHVQDHGGNLLSLTSADGRSVRAQVVLSETADARPVAVSRRNGSVVITVDRRSGTAESERHLARAVTMLLMSETGTSQGHSILSRSPLPAQAGPDSLTLDDHGGIAEIAELLHQVNGAGPISRATLEQRLHRLVDQAGLRLGARDAAERRALLPPALVTDLDVLVDDQRDHQEVTVVESATAELDRLGRATGLDLSIDPADAGMLRLRLADGTFRTVRVSVGSHASGTVAVPTIAGGSATVVIDGRSSSTAAAIALAGALAELVARSENAPSGPLLLRPAAVIDPITSSGLTPADRRGLAELRMAGLLTESVRTGAAATARTGAAPDRTGAAARWRSALTEELGLRGSGDGPAMRRGVLTPVEERELAGRHGVELDEIVLARQFVEAAADRAGAEAIRVSADRVVVTRNGRQVDVDLVVAAPDADGQASARVEIAGGARLRVVVTHGAEVNRLALTIDQLIEETLSDEPASSADSNNGNPPPPRGGPPSSPGEGQPDPGSPRAETEEEFFARMRREVNTSGQGEDDEEDWCTCEPGQPCACGKRPVPGPPVAPDQPLTDGWGHDDREEEPPGPTLLPPAAVPPLGTKPEADQRRPAPTLPPVPTPGLPPRHPPGPPPAPPAGPEVTPPPPTGGQSPATPPSPGDETRPQPGTPPPDVRWLDFIDPWGNRHAIALVDWPLPGGGSLRLLVWLILPAGTGAPAVVVSELVGTAGVLALREHIAAVGEGIVALIAGHHPDLDPSRLRWLVHHGPFSSPDATLPETFHEVVLRFDGRRGVAGVRLLDRPETEAMVVALNLRPVSQVLNTLSADVPDVSALSRPDRRPGVEGLGQ